MTTFALRRRLDDALSSPVVSVAVILVMTAGAMMAATQADGYFVFIIALVAINVIVAVGLNVLWGLSGQISFGHVGFFAIGAYTTAIAMNAGWSFWLALPAAGVLSALVGGLLAIPALRVSGPYLAMMTIAFAFIVENIAIEWRGVTGGQNGIAGFPSPELFGRMFFEMEMALLGCIVAGISLLAYLFLSRGNWGQAMRAVQDSEVAAQSVGLAPLRIKTVAFIVSALLTGLAGAMFAPLQMFISPGTFPFFQSILFLLAVVVGGAGTLIGPVIGCLIIVLLPELLSGLAEYRLLFFGALMLGVLLAAPRGIAGTLASLVAAEDPSTAKPSGRSLEDVVGVNKAAATLVVDGVGISFGGVRAAHDVGFTAEPGKVTSVIGPNGAGKTTVLNMIGGFYRPDQGTIALEHNIAGRPAWAVSRAGIARTYQTTQLFEGLSVIDNILIAGRRGKLGSILGALPDAAARQQAQDLLVFVGYTGPLGRKAGALPHVDKRLVEIARALATRPHVLLLDEPAAGLGQTDKTALSVLLTQIAAAGIAVIVVEHDMGLVMGVSDKIVVLDAGTPICTGTPAEVRADPGVRRAYLGDDTFSGRPRETAWAGERLAVLTTHKLGAGYGAAPVLSGVSITVDPGEMVALLGANGAGKSTMMRSISGLHRPVEGSVLLDNEDIGTSAAHTIAASGLALVPEGRQVFPEMTVRDNIRLGAYSRKDVDVEAEITAQLRRFPRLAERADFRAGVLSGGEQQMLAIARGLIANPRIILLDEPSLGLAPAIVRELYDALADLRDEGVTILLVDQMAMLALDVADRAYVLETGRVVEQGNTKDLRNDAGIEAAYLGTAAE